ncbi:MAG: dienelactone hydrolase family protein [Gemmatimonadaceae bacterium]
MRYVRAAAALALVFAGSCMHALHTRPESTRIAIFEDQAAVKSGDDQLKIDIYRPQKSGRYPVAILLHGSGGIHAIGSSDINRYAAAMAEEGVITYVVHYFDGTGDFTASDSIETAHYFRWVQEVRDVISWAATQKDVQPRRISLVGHSLGAWLAVGVGAFDQRVFRLVLLGSGLEPFLIDSIKRMPPTLLLHGADDDVVPLSDMQHLQAFMSSKGFRVTTHIYPAESHSFGDSVAVDALTRAAVFISPRRRPN